MCQCAATVTCSTRPERARVRVSPWVRIAIGLSGVFAAPAAAAGVVAVMFGVVVWPAGRRLNAHRDTLRAVVAACGAGASVRIGIIVGCPR